MEIEKFIGNFKQLETIIYWLDSWFREPTKEIKSHVIIFASSGNGKSTIPQLLANDFKVELFTISPYDITSKNDLNNFIKSLNLQTLKGKKHKIILIDDINEFPSQYKKRLCELPTISHNPIIYTSSNYQMVKGRIPQYIIDFKRKALAIRIYKPFPNQLFKHLKTLNSKLPDETLQQIAKESKSVRSAINSLYNASINDLTHDIQTNYTLVRDFKKRNLNRNLIGRDIKTLFDCIEGYDLNSLKLKARLADLDWRMSRYWREIGFRELDPYILNNMTEDIENTSIDAKRLYNKKKKYYKKSKKYEKEEAVIEKKVDKTVNVGKWL